MQIDEEAAKVHLDLEVSRTLMFSSPEVQEQFHLWMGNFEAVRWYSCAVVGIQIMFAFWVPVSKVECGWVHFLTLLSTVAIPTARLVMEMGGGAKYDQSLCSTVAAAYFYVVYYTFQASNDACFGGLGPDGTSLATTASYAAMATIADHCISPCTMQHLSALCWTIGIGIFINVYTQYLRQNGGLGMWTSDPNLLGLIAIAFSTASAVLVVYCTRVFLAKKFMIAFLKSIRRNR